MIVLFTDFGADDIYVGQMKAVLLQQAPRDVGVVDLLHSAPAFDPRAAAHLLAALQARFPRDSVFVAVVDPGVGTSRDAVVVQADGKWYVGPDNGLLAVVAARAAQAQCWRIVWRPAELCASFHGRDLFAPMAATIAAGAFPHDKLESIADLHVALDPGDLGEVIYVDHYGNAITGLRARNVARSARIIAGECRMAQARVFGEAAEGAAIWYENSIGLVEIACNRASAAAMLGLAVGDCVRVIDGARATL